MISTRPANITDFVLPLKTEGPSSTSSPTSTYSEGQRTISVFHFDQSIRSGENSPAEKSTTKLEFLSTLHPNVKTLPFSSSPSLTSTTQTSSNSYYSTCPSRKNQVYNQHRNQTVENHQQQYSTLLTSQYFPDDSGNFSNCSDLTDFRNRNIDVSANEHHFNLFNEQDSDINNNNSGSYNFNFGQEQTFFDNCGRITPIDNNGKLARLPPFEVLLPSSPGKLGVSETSQIASDSMLGDHSDYYMTSSSSSMGDENQYTCLTNVCPTSHEPDLNYIVSPDINNDWFDCGYGIKCEPDNDLYNMPFDDTIVSPTSDSDYDSSSTERLTFNSSSTTGSDCASFEYSPSAEGHYRSTFNELESYSSDESFRDDRLPDIEILQGCEDKSQRKRNGALSLKDKKKPVRESPQYVEKERRKPGRKPGQVSNVLHLWEFMRDLLQSSENQGIIEWICKPDGVFRVTNSTEVARLWGAKKKNKKSMTYEKMSRSLRYSRLEGYFADLPRDKNYPKKLCFKFGPKSGVAKKLNHVEGLT